MQLCIVFSKRFILICVYIYIYILYIYIEDLRGHADGNHLRDMRKYSLTEKLHSLAKALKSFFSHIVSITKVLCAKKKKKRYFLYLAACHVTSENMQMCC